VFTTRYFQTGTVQIFSKPTQVTRRRASGRHGAREGISRHAARFFYRCTKHSSYVPADAGFQCDTAAVPGDTIKETDCVIVRGAYNKSANVLCQFLSPGETELQFGPFRVLHLNGQGPIVHNRKHVKISR